MTARDDDDDHLLDLLGLALRQADPLPPAAKEAAIAGFSWRTMDADLAALVYDSAMELTGAGARSDEVARQLTFESDGTELEVMIVANGDRRLLGQLVPPRETTVTLACAGNVHRTRSDELGRFRFEVLGSGPSRLSVAAGPVGPGLETEWIVL